MQAWEEDKRRPERLFVEGLGMLGERAAYGQQGRESF